jgi:hypothetical protein
MAPPNRSNPREQLGCPRGLGRCSAARGLRQAVDSVHRSCFSARRSGCPVLVASKRGFTPRRSRLRLVNRSRFPLCSARRLRSEDSVIQFRLACAPRYVAYTRGPITPGQGVFSNPQGYPRKFPSIPRNTGVVHRSCTGKSPDLRPTGSDFVDGTAAFGLNGADGTTPGHGRDHYVEHVSPRARQAARGRLFCCPHTGHRSI